MGDTSAAFAAAGKTKQAMSSEKSAFMKATIMPRIVQAAIELSCPASLRAAEVSALAGVDANLFAFVDEGGHLDDEAGFGPGGLADAGGGGRL